MSVAASANVKITGAVSIPLMKKLGYKPEFAAALEASVSTGGQLMPPIMGAAAFIISSILGISYIKVCLHVHFPALLWFFSFFITLHFAARRMNLKPMPKDELPRWSDVLKELYLFIAIGTLVIFLTMGYSAYYTGFLSTVLILILSFIKKKTRFTVISFIEALEYGMTSVLPIVASCAAAGIIIGCVNQSGIGFFLSAALVHFCGGNLAVLLGLCLIVSLILGIGMTTTGAYIIV